MVDECERRTRERWCGMTQLLLYRITIPSSNVYRSSRWRRSNCVKIFASFQRSLLKFNAIIARSPPPPPLLIDFKIIAGQNTLYFFNLYGDKIWLSSLVNRWIGILYRIRVNVGSGVNCEKYSEKMNTRFERGKIWRKIVYNFGNINFFGSIFNKVFT